MKRYLRKPLMLGIYLPAAALTLGAFSYQPLEYSLPLDLPQPVAAQTQADEPPQLADLNLPDYVYTIQPGDTLSTIFERLGVSQKEMYQVLESDVSILALDTLKPGDKLGFWLDQGRLVQLELSFDISHQVVFTRASEEEFEYAEVRLEGEWREQVIAGEINGSFFTSAKRAGLSAAEVQSISSLLQDKINFRRDLRAGDRFQVVRSEQYVDGEPTGKTRLEGLRVLNRSRELTAFMFDGNYYDLNGESLARAFMRYPTKRSYRLSSHFNPNRKHPVTGRVRPHNGTDFATPIGTPVLATGDGVVTRVTKHPYAGLYIVIEHGEKYKTRFLHLSKALVRKGQTVSRGQKIALSGNSGRSTGPHLHYELHINGRPVNAMKAPIPVADAVGKDDRMAFNQIRDRLLDQMNASQG
ncbi:peptidoglycan DD-metalloendopeptidase family protein [Marinobacterium sediminicola]|uniref:Murein DD-endopeptidase n=1 Tax=Marinobacterium sediminicola TaxID=518898 RepID=A0ABY1RXD4_9GAMM|nr:peptidoglycan DD-metalloendopeptidase family protein [Marinobacterium sediminicola]ULG67831.1 peptidoglycan DD-metalloendopeptidase family protein [Marinobacterium sediminicola]SMR71489.1 murein DD-endopeptidase [Marinobacterium sediminicola]